MVRSALKRGALLTAANWQIVVVQGVTDSIFRLLVAIPLIGGAFLAALLVDRDLWTLLGGGLGVAATTIAGELSTRPAALTAFAAAFATMVVGGSILVFLVKGGSASILAAADRLAGPIERPPLRIVSITRAAQFSIEAFSAGASALGRRFVGLGLWLIIAYALTGGLFAVGMLQAYRSLAPSIPMAAWTAIAVLALLAGAVWVAAINLIYVVTQAVIAFTGRGLFGSLRSALTFVRADRRKVGRAFGVVLFLYALATGLSLLAVAGLGLIAFVPVAGLAVIPIQLGAAFFRSLLNQFLGLTALVAYLTLYRSWAVSSGSQAGTAAAGDSPFISELES